jgi:hypothetical protein
MHRTLLPWVGVVSAFVLVIGWGTVGRAETDFPVYLSGLETSGGSLTADGVRHNVTFKGWVGGTGAVRGGWVASPGDGGSWRMVIHYCCASTRQQQHMVTILGGRWQLQLPDGDHFTGSVESGTVWFASTLAKDLGCGPGVTQVSATLLFDADEQTSDAKACLDDRHGLHPPPIWGTISTPQP